MVMQTVKQLADEMGVSKTAVMKQIKKLGVELQKEANHIIIDDVTAENIKQQFAKNRKPIDNQTANRQPEIENRKPQTDNQTETEKQVCFDGVFDNANRKPIENQNDNQTANRQPEIENQSQTYFSEYVQLLHEQIADLKAEKAMMQQRIDEKDAHIMEMHRNAEKHSQQMEEMRLKLEGVEKQLELMAAVPEENEIIIQPEPEQQEEKTVQQPEPEPQKKGFFARLFGGNS